MAWGGGGAGPGTADKRGAGHTPESRPAAAAGEVAGVGRGCRANGCGRREGDGPAIPGAADSRGRPGSGSPATRHPGTAMHRSVQTHLLPTRVSTRLLSLAAPSSSTATSTRQRRPTSLATPMLPTSSLQSGRGIQGDRGSLRHELLTRGFSPRGPPSTPRAWGSPPPSSSPPPPPRARAPNCWVVGLDVTHQCQLSRRQLDGLQGVGRHGSFLSAISQFYLSYHKHVGL